LNSNAFSSTPIGGYGLGAGSIYVPTSLLTSYQTATNWTYFSSRFVGISNTGGDIGGDFALITFTIDEVEYQAEDGMAFGEWVVSSYNTDGWFFDDDSNMHCPNNYGFLVVSVSDVIVSGENYETEI
jgi:hypothetical protein